MRITETPSRTLLRLSALLALLAFSVAFYIRFYALPHKVLFALQQAVPGALLVLSAGCVFLASARMSSISGTKLVPHILCVALVLYLGMDGARSAVRIARFERLDTPDLVNLRLSPADRAKLGPYYYLRRHAAGSTIRKRQRDRLDPKFPAIARFAVRETDVPECPRTDSIVLDRDKYLKIRGTRTYWIPRDAVRKNTVYVLLPYSTGYLLLPEDMVEDICR